MFSKFSKKYWGQKYRSSRQSAFGGEVKSQEEIERLNQKIKAHEAVEAAKADMDIEMNWPGNKK